MRAAGVELRQSRVAEEEEPMFQLCLLRSEQIEPLAEGVLQVLARVGVLCENEEMCRALREWGAEVDFAAQRVRFPRRQVEAFIEQLRREEAGRQPEWGTHFPPPSLPGIGTQVAQITHDFETGEQRNACTRDFITFTQLGAVLHPEKPVGHSLSLTDVPPVMEPLEAGLLLAEWAPIPGLPFIWRADQADYLNEMGQLLGIDHWFTWGATCFAHPLRFDRDTAGKFVRRVREGASAGLTAMPVAGASTPITVEGFIVVSSAEQIATWIAGRALNPAVPLSGSIWAGTIDMKSGTVSYSAPDAMGYAFATVEFLRRWCGMRIAVGSGEYCAAKQPSLYTALEKAHKSMTVSAFTGQPASPGGGLLDEGRALSAVQLLLDREMAASTAYLAPQVDPTPERIGLDAILEVGIGLETNYLQTEHTLRLFRDSLWLPTLLDRTGWNGPSDEAAILQRTHAKVKELLAEYRKPEGREELLAAMRQVVEKARKKLLA
ncbi:MAG TPA: trimethylamine methyltransferase family protein [Armatimonadota bacterium]|nr:trimethylamine methyltransferase family protein [Armatimonadota bacterium]HPO71291.1 trimethylamine methyltransferase family protein [Armatimonadota bacterium]